MMDPQRIRRIAELFELAVDLPAGERTRFLKTQCLGDDDLFAEVQKTLHHDNAAGRFLEGSRQPFVETDDLRREYTTAIPDQIGGYQIRRKIGEGGMGIVYEASQQRISRPVALKVLRHGHYSTAVLRRFEYEAQLLGRLHHPCIAQVYEAGLYETQSGALPFFAMEFVAGALPITEYVATHDMDTRRRLECFALVCDAVHHGHQKGVIHRDLKPSNILVDASGQPKVIDFGVACCVDPDAAMPTMQTSFGQLVGTVQYMSPEQCAANRGDIDTRSDVYSLGVVLFQLITGRMPYSAPTESLFETMRAVREGTPTRLSAINRRLGGDLDTIVRKAMEKDRTHRYQSAAEFGEDIRRFLRLEPIIARPPTMLYQFRRFARRNRALVGGIAAAIVVLISGIIATSIQTMHANLARADADLRAYEACIFAADAAVAANDGGAAKQRLNSAPSSLRNWEWRYLNRCADQSVAVFKGLAFGTMVQVSFSPDGRRIAGVSQKSGLDSRLHVWDVATGNCAWEGSGRPGAFVPYAFSANGNVSMYDARNELRLIDPTRGTEVDRRPLLNAITDFKPVILSRSSWVQAWNEALPTYRVAFWSAGEAIDHGDFPLDESRWMIAGAISENGRRIAVGQNDGTVLVCDAVSGAVPTHIHALDSETYGVALSDDGSRLAVCGDGGLIKVWTLGSLSSTAQYNPILFRQIASLRGSAQRAMCAAFSPDRASLAVGSCDKTIRIWRLSDESLQATLLGHDGMVSSVAFSPDGKFIVSGSSDSTVRLWSPSVVSAVTIRRDMPGIISVVSFDRSGSRLMTHVARGMQRVLDAVTGRTLFDMSTQSPAMDRAAFGRDGDWVVNQGEDGIIRGIDMPSAHERFRFETGIVKAMLPVALSPDETQLAWSDTSGRIELFDTRSRLPVGDLNQQGDRVNAIAYSPDGKYLAAGTASGALAIWNLSDKQRKTLPNHQSEVMSIAYSANGRRIATTSQDETVNLCNATDGRIIRTIHPKIGDVWCAAFSPDGTRLAVGGRDRTVRLYDTDNGSELLTLRGPTGTVMSITFSPDGCKIAAGSWSKEVFIWDAGKIYEPSPEKGSQ